MILLSRALEASKLPIVRMYSENMPKTRLAFCQKGNNFCASAGDEYDGTVDI